VGFCDTEPTEANEANFAVFCQNFVQNFLTNQKLPGNSRPGIKTVPIPGNFRSEIPDGLDPNLCIQNLSTLCPKKRPRFYF